MARDLEGITKAYWEVGYAVRHPDSGVLTTAEAFKLLRNRDFLRPNDWRLTELMHTLTYDIIEGDIEWRGGQQVQGSALILHMKDWISIQKTQEASSRTGTQ